TSWPRDWSSDVCSSDLDVAVTNALEEDLPDCTQNLVAGKMSVPVVDLLEVVEIAEDERHLVPEAAGSVELAAEPVVERAPIEKRSEERRVGKEGRQWRG